MKVCVVAFFYVFSTCKERLKRDKDVKNFQRKQHINDPLLPLLESQSSSTAASFSSKSSCQQQYYILPKPAAAHTASFFFFSRKAQTVSKSSPASSFASSLRTQQPQRWWQRNRGCCTTTKTKMKQQADRLRSVMVAPAGKSWHYTNEFARLIFIPYTQETRHMIHQPTTHKKLFFARCCCYFYFAQLLFLPLLLLCRRYKEKWSPYYSTLCHSISKGNYAKHNLLFL